MHQLPRFVFDAAVQWAMRADNSAFWKGRKPAKAETAKESMMASRKAGTPGGVRVKSEE
jgi:phosphoinositide-3-kinase regulatory subunit 4